MTAPLRISAKTLGSVALPGFCPRCFWIQMHAEGIPYQIFPGIFSSIDAYGKRLVHGRFDRHGGPPPWLAPLGDIKGYLPPPHFSKFNVVDDKTSIQLTGTPDGILLLADGSHLIVDYKTAKFTATQDELFPMYEAQLNAYAYIGERRGLAPVSGLALVYTEPVTDEKAAHTETNVTQQGFRMDFSAHLLLVKIIPELVPRLLRTARKVYDLPQAPERVPNCEDCELLDGLLKATRK
jgi:hypothetical protein